MSRCLLVPERLTDAANDVWTPVTDDPVVSSVLRSYRNQHDSSAALVRRHAWHYQVSGEAIQTVEQSPSGDVFWYIHGTTAVQVSGADRPVLVADLPGGSVFNGGAREVPPDQVRRFWQPDEDYPMLATSPLLAVLEDCERYVLLGRRTKREAKSALGMNGLLFTPESAHRYPTGPDGRPSLYSQLDQDLTQIASKGWESDEGLASLAPFSVHYGNDKDTVVPQWIDVGKTLDPKVLEARREALECIVRGLPIPNIIGIEGTAGATGNHWNAWKVSEDFFSAVAPLADTITHDDITSSVFHPILRQLSSAGKWQGNPDEWRVGYDPTPVIIHPDKAGRSVELYKVGALSRLTTLIENGFSELDAPSDEELAKFVETQQALRQAQGAPPGGGAGMANEGPPATQPAALSPFPTELDAWLADA